MTVMKLTFTIPKGLLVVSDINLSEINRYFYFHTLTRHGNYQIADNTQIEHFAYMTLPLSNTLKFITRDILGDVMSEDETFTFAIDESNDKIYILPRISKIFESRIDENGKLELSVGLTRPLSPYKLINKFLEYVIMAKCAKLYETLFNWKLTENEEQLLFDLYYLLPAGEPDKPQSRGMTTDYFKCQYIESLLDIDHLNINLLNRIASKYSKSVNTDCSKILSEYGVEDTAIKSKLLMAIVYPDLLEEVIKEYTEACMPDVLDLKINQFHINHVRFAQFNVFKDASALLEDDSKPLEVPTFIGLLHNSDKSHETGKLVVTFERSDFKDAEYYVIPDVILIASRFLNIDTFGESIICLFERDKELFERIKGVKENESLYCLSFNAMFLYNIRRENCIKF